MLICRKHIETSGDLPLPMSGSTACVIGGKYMYVFAGHHDGGPSSTVSFISSAYVTNSSPVVRVLLDYLRKVATYVPCLICPNHKDIDIIASQRLATTRQCDT